MKQKSWLMYLLISVLGVLSIVLPIFLQPDIKHYESPLFPLIRTGIEGFSLWSFAFLFSTGFAIRFLTKLPSWKIGLTTITLFPVMAILEVIVDSSSHNMLPFEFIFYAVYTIPAIIGANLAQLVLS